MENWEKVTVDELKVSVSALRINGKSMSASIFRQVPILDICDPNGDPLPFIQPWGIVKQGQSDIIDWLLFLHDSKLYRAAISSRYMTHFDRQVEKARTSLFDAEAKLQDLIKSSTADSQTLERRKLVENFRQQLAIAERALSAEVKRFEVHKYAMTLPQLYIGG